MKLDGDDLEIHYRHTLEELGKRSGMLGVIFRKAQNKIQDPAKLRRLIADLIDKEEWSSLSADVKGEPTRASCRRTPRTWKEARANISRRARSFRRWWR